MKEPLWSSAWAPGEMCRTLAGQIHLLALALRLPR